MSIDLRDLNGYRQLPGQGSPADATRDSAASSAKESRGSEAADHSADRTAAADKVELSSTARTLRALADSAQLSDGIDSDRVARIREQIAEGRYHVDAGKLADRMIDLERALLG
ncbi:MAG: flagellar biosynthesis anti-sigma factor FlgM [Pseudomonadales bacterium]